MTKSVECPGSGVPLSVSWAMFAGIFGWERVGRLGSWVRSRGEGRCQGKTSGSHHGYTDGTAGILRILEGAVRVLGSSDWSGAREGPHPKGERR